MRQFLLSCLFLLAITPLFGQNRTVVLFESDQYTLTTEQEGQLQKLIKDSLKTAEQITLIGHTDNQGSDAYNKTLSQKRADHILEKLKQAGINTAMISTSFVGEKQPLNANRTVVDRQLNRRVEIRWANPEPVEEYGDIRELYRLLEADKCDYCINPKRDTVLYLPQGTVIQIPANAFTTKNNECIRFTAKEVYKYSNMVLENLTTTSNGQLLETAGMVYTEATDASGRQLQLNTGKSLTILLPTDTLRSDMQLFYGERDPHSDMMNWISAPDGSLIPMNFGGCMWAEGGDECVRCRILFCRLFGRVDETVKGIGNKAQRATNKSFRACQRSLRKGGGMTGVSSGNYYYDTDCDRLMNIFGAENWQALNDSLRKRRDALLAEKYAEYGVDTYEAYTDTLQKIRMAERQKLYDQYGVSNELELQDTLQKLRIKQEEDNWKAMQDRLENNEGSSADMLYYVAKTAKMGWLNCDAFYRVPSAKKTEMITDLKSTPEIDCRLAFIKKRGFYPAVLIGAWLGFQQIPKRERAWLLALKYTKGQAYIHLEKTTIDKKSPPIQFRPVTIAELKEELKKLD